MNPHHHFNYQKRIKLYRYSAQIEQRVYNTIIHINYLIIIKP